MSSRDTPDEVGDVHEFILQNTKRRKILLSILKNGKGYLSQLSRDLKLSKRTVLLQLGELEKRGVISFDWETKYIGEEKRPVYLKVFRATPKFKWLKEKAEKGDLGRL